MITEQKQSWRSFAGGEIAEELYGRFDLAKNQTGLKRCYNFSVTPQGVLVKRSGSRFIAVAPASTMRLEPFIAPSGKGFLLAIRNLKTQVFDTGVEVDELDTPWNTAELPYLSSAQFVNDFTVCSRNYVPHYIRRVSDSSWTNSNITFNATLAAPTGLVVQANEITSMDPGDPRITYNYVVTALTETGAESAVSAGASGNNILRIAGNNNTLAWAGVTGAFRYNVYASRQNGAYGFIGSSRSSPFVDDNISPDQFTQPAEALATFSTSADYPRAVTFHDQRMLLANTPNDPQSFWASGLAGFDYFKASFPPQDDQAFTYQLASKRAAPILHMLSLRDVLFFTDSGVHMVFTTGDAGFAPGSVGSIQVSAYGAQPDVRPQEAGNSVLFPAARSSHIIALKYDGSGEGYAGDDLSLLAPHLIDGYTWKQTGFQTSPYPVWWGLRSDSVLVCLTYVAEQQVFAWHQIELPDTVISSFAIVPEGANDSIYLHVQRFIDGDFVYYIERLEPPFGNTQLQQNAICLDCCKTYSGAATATITGLGHLEGEEVMALAQGQPMGPYTVTDGQITIDEAATLVHVGKLYDAEAETLPLVYDVAGAGVGAAKNPAAVYLRLKRSADVEAGTSEDELYPLAPDATALIGSPVQLRDGVHEIAINGEWSSDGSLLIRQRSPLPATITGIAVSFSGAD